MTDNERLLDYNLGDVIDALEQKGDKNFIGFIMVADIPRLRTWALQFFAAEGQDLDAYCAECRANKSIPAMTLAMPMTTAVDTLQAITDQDQTEKLNRLVGQGWRIVVVTTERITYHAVQKRDQ